MTHRSLVNPAARGWLTAVAPRLRRSPRIFSPGRRSGIHWPFLLGVGSVLFLLTVVPLTILLVSSFRPDGLPSTPGWTTAHYVDIWGSARNWRLVANTLAFAVCSTFLAVVLSTGLSWLLERSDMPARNLFRSMILMPMATPPLLLAIAWALILAPRIGIVQAALRPLVGPLDQWSGIYNMPGCIFVQTLAYVPTAVLMLSPAIRAFDPALEEAALVSGAGSWQVLWRIGLPLLRPALLSVTTILLIVSMLAFDVPSVIAIPGNVDLMSIEIYRLMTPPIGFPDYGGATAMNALLFVLLIGGLIVYRRTTRWGARFATIRGKGYKPAEIRLGRWRTVAGGLVGFYFVLAVAMPFVALAWASVIPYFTGFSVAMLRRASFAAYADLFASQQVWGASLNSALIAIAAATTLALLALATAWIVLRAKLRFAWLVDVLAMIPMGVPALMIGVALVVVAFSVRFLGLYGTIWLIAIGHVIVYLPISSRMMQSGLLQIGSELEEAASVAGANVLRTFRQVILPLLKPAVIAMVIWVLVHSVREFSIAVMLQSGRNAVLSTLLYNYWDTGSPDHAAALAVLLMLLLLALVGITTVLTPRKLEL